MGNSSTKSAAQQQPTGKAAIKSKIEKASKVGILNLSDQNLKPSSSVYVEIWNLATILKTLDLSGNAMKQLPENLQNFVILRSLSLSRCYLQRSRDLAPLVALQTLRLDHNDFEHTTLLALPPNCIRCDLSSNHFTHFPTAAFTGLLKLVELRLSNNRLVSLEGISCLVALETLFLDGNNLTEIPEEIGTLKKLLSLSFMRNKLGKKAADGQSQSIHPSVFKNTQLTTLDLAGNSLLLKDIMDMDGTDVFIERRKKHKDKTFSGGAMTDMSIFGLE
jgi:leucine-rich repeat protein SHOC2